jgi:hypothetical protein
MLGHKQALLYQGWVGKNSAGVGFAVGVGEAGLAPRASE